MSGLRKILSVTMCLCLLIGCMTGCGEKYKEAYIYFELLDVPKTLDPQIASSDSELLIARNIYEGLLRRDNEGNIVNGACESYTYSNLTYTFKLKKDLTWSDGTPLTAYDFEYGLRRAVDPRIKSPNVSRLFSIVNAEAIAGGNADISALGVKAEDEHTLTISMCREDEFFTDTLTTAICMPCNQDFFESSVGKYGLDAECILSNGSYSLTKWNKEDFGIRLYKNEEYTGDFKAQNAAVFISCNDEEKQIFRLSEGETDMAFLPCSELDETADGGFTTQNVQNVCWVMTISREFDPGIRRAFALAFSTDVYKSALPDGFAPAKSIYPEILGVNTDGVGLTAYDIEESKSLMSAQIAQMENNKFPQSTLYYYESDGVKGLATAIVGHWQQNLSTFVNIEGSDNLAVIKNEIGESTLDFALFPIAVRSDIFSEYAANFRSASTATAPEVLQQELLANHCMIPVAYQDTNISYVSTLENVVMEEDNGYIDFSFVIKR